MAMLTTKAAAELLGVKESTLRYWRMLHIGPPYYQLTARTIRYDGKELEKFIAAGRHDPIARTEAEMNSRFPRR